MSDNPKLRLGYLVSRYPAISHTFILREVRLLREMGISIETASINDPEPSLEQLPEEEKEEALRTFYVKKNGAFNCLIEVFRTFFQSPWKTFMGLYTALRLGRLDLRKIILNLFYFGEAIVVGQWMQSKNISHLHVHFANPASQVALILSKIFCFSYSMTIHGPDEFYDVEGQRLTEKVEGAKFIVCISYYAQSQLIKITHPSQWSKFSIIRQGVDPSVYFPSKNRNREKKLAVCVGRLVPSKGQFTLIAAMNLLKKQGIEIHLRIVGDGIDRAILEKEVRQRNLQDSITFVGAKTQKEVLEIYRLTDLCILHSFAEGIPVSLMESMSMEIPCISTYVNGIPELIEHKKEGYLSIPSDVAGLVSTIRFALDHPEVTEKVAREGRKKILSQYCLKDNVCALKNLFLEQLLIQD